FRSDPHQPWDRQPERARELTDDELGDERLGPLPGAAKLDDVTRPVVGLDQAGKGTAFTQRCDESNGAYARELGQDDLVSVVRAYRGCPPIALPVTGSRSRDADDRVERPCSDAARRAHEGDAG